MNGGDEDLPEGHYSSEMSGTENKTTEEILDEMADIARRKGDTK